MASNENGERKPVSFSKSDEAISDAIQANDQLRELLALRRVLATHLDNAYTPSSAIAALSRQYRDLSDQIADLQAKVSEDVDEYSGPTLVEDADWKPHAI